MTTWKFVAEGGPRVGAESALDACDYFVDEVIEPWKVRGKENESHQKFGECRRRHCNKVWRKLNKFTYSRKYSSI